MNNFIKLTITAIIGVASLNAIEMDIAPASTAPHQNTTRYQRFTTLEDEQLKDLVDQHGKNWTIIAEQMPNRTSGQCRDRYERRLAPGLTRSAWTAEEDIRLIELHEQYGNKWAAIAKILENRSDVNVRIRWQFLLHHNATTLAAYEEKYGNKANTEKENSDLTVPTSDFEFLFDSEEAENWFATFDDSADSEF